jgi:hypothetical protein
MTSLPETALAFCREVLGWKDAQRLGDFEVLTENGGNGPVERFAFNDLNEIMEAVYEWCAEKCDIPIEIRFSKGVSVSFWNGGGWTAVLSGEKFNRKQLCRALMFACLQAARKEPRY